MTKQTRRDKRRKSHTRTKPRKTIVRITESQRSSERRKTQNTNTTNWHGSVNASTADRKYAASVRKQLASIMAQADVERNARMSQVLTTSNTHERPAPNGTLQHLAAGWAATSAQLIQHEQLDIERELHLATNMLDVGLIDQNDRAGRHAFNERQQKLLQSLERAAQGKIQLTVNKHRPKETEALTSIRTRAEYQAFTQHHVDALYTEALSVEYLGNRISIMIQFRIHCHEGWGISFLRVEWLRAMNDPLVLWVEENIMLSFFGYLSFRLKGEGAIIAITHVKQFHLAAQIPPPQFLRLKENNAPQTGQSRQHETQTSTRQTGTHQTARPQIQRRVVGRVQDAPRTEMGWRHAMHRHRSIPARHAHQRDGPGRSLPAPTTLGHQKVQQGGHAHRGRRRRRHVSAHTAQMPHGSCPDESTHRIRCG